MDQFTPQMPDEPIVLEIDGTLDLHQFAPGDSATLIADYLEECRSKNIFQVRIIHGKGTGALQRSVHAVLKRLNAVASFRLADETGGSWGATIVVLKKR